MIKKKKLLFILYHVLKIYPLDMPHVLIRRLVGSEEKPAAACKYVALTHYNYPSNQMMPGVCVSAENSLVNVPL